MFFTFLLLWLCIFLHCQVHAKPLQRIARKPPHAESALPITPLNHPKPAWVKTEIIRLKAHMGHAAGCRRIALTFNRLHGLKITVGKSYVAEMIKQHQYQIACLRRHIKQTHPYPIAVNHTWAMDICFVSCPNDPPHPLAVLGVIDHGSRLVTQLQVITHRSSWALLGHLCMAIARYGKPTALRTDNENVFNSFVFRTFLRLVNIHKQTIPPLSPWKNGRIERLFGTFKTTIKRLSIQNAQVLQQVLGEFRFFYNTYRPHQNLNGLTPAEMWQGKTMADIQAEAQHQPTIEMVQALAGELVAFRRRE